MLRIINLFVGLFGYQFIIDNEKVDEPEENIIADEGWDDLHQHSPRYKLVRKPSSSRE